MWAGQGIGPFCSTSLEGFQILTSTLLHLYNSLTPLNIHHLNTANAASTLLCVDCLALENRNDAHVIKHIVDWVTAMSFTVRVFAVI